MVAMPYTAHAAPRLGARARAAAFYVLIGAVAIAVAMPLVFATAQLPAYETTITVAAAD